MTGNPIPSALNQQTIFQRAFEESTDRLRTDATFTGDISAEIKVEIDAASGDNVALSNADGTKKVTVTTVGSHQALDVNIASSEPLVVSIQNPGTIVNAFNSVTSVPSSTLTTIVTKTITKKSEIRQILVSGTNIAEYTVLLNSNIIAKVRTSLTELNYLLTFNGLSVNTGDVIQVKVIHYRPSLGDFDANIMINEL